MRRLILACVTVFLIVPALAWAGSAGNPAVTIGKDNYGVAIEAEEQTKLLDNDLVTSRRYVCKLIWGATDKLDLYARLGASGLVVEVSEGPDFETPPRNMTWGGGARYTIAGLDKPRLLTYVDLQMLTFFAENTVDVEGSSDGADTYTEQQHTRYKYNEVQFNFITSWQHDVFAPYIGFGITNIFGHVDREVSEFDGDIVKDGNDFREDAIPEFIMGVDADLGDLARLSGEIRLNSESDLSFFIGLSELWR